ncbi:ABC transporter permease [Paenibacillus aurantius]|uniref:ABC transporter permease n=1 Tax=Paenibacillus aurantius TaxID=2918900 RepID=A0AA96LF06_9BACL|nr:ABC transporter permease [Paenibacillus aurantius]WNQ12849.1 ABC transporter permease [Paenibacillus aurantius]
MIRRNGPALLFLVLLALAWEAAAVVFRIPHFILPRPSGVLAALWDQRDVLLKHSVVTLREALAGLALSVLFGVTVAAWIHSSKLARRAVYPLVVISQTIPIVALSPVMVMWFGYTIWSKIAVVILFTFFPVTVNTVDGLRTVDPDLRDLMKTMGARKRDLFLKLQVPSALPGFFTGFKMAAAFSVVGATIGEWLGAEAGLGMFSKRASNMLRAEQVFAAILLLSVMGLLLFLLAWALEARLTKRMRR